MNIAQKHKKNSPKIETEIKPKIRNKKDLAVFYTPGVGEISKKISKNKKLLFDFTIKKNCVAVISDGSAILGFGNLGAEAALPVMEGKCILFKKFGGLNAFPMTIKTQDPEEFVNVVKNIQTPFSAINLEDISAPKCFEIEEKLKKECDVPVVHDDQHATSIVVLAGLINAFKFANKNLKNSKIVVNGVGAAGFNIVKLLHYFGVKNIIACDSKGALYKGRPNMNVYKKEVANYTNKEKVKTLKEALINADAFVGVSAPNVLNKDLIRKMAEKPIIFALANPIPEIYPQDALKAGAFVVATGRSDFQNQINNALVFPGLFKGMIEKGKKELTMEMKVKVAMAIANSVKRLSRNKIIPSIFQKNLHKIVAKAV